MPFGNGDEFTILAQDPIGIDLLPLHGHRCTAAQRRLLSHAQASCCVIIDLEERQMIHGPRQRDQWWRFSEEKRVQGLR